ncbi:DUF397 domain-containing protein [Amycolatopsis sp. NBC_00438]|uniref:DUF397 domain-containing protein n=1 Tax=Amycolatopsis sp. NBC_00438 TaxID=2903558 RepID=UPI002E220987
MPIDERTEMAWRKSSYSNANGCLEVSLSVSSVVVRDAKAPSSGNLALGSQAWRAFLITVAST